MNKGLLALFLVCLSIAALTGFELINVLAIPAANTNSVVEPGSLMIPPRYVVYRDGSGSWFSKDGNGQGNSNSNSDCATELQWALNNLDAGRTWKEAVQIRDNCTISSSILLPSYSQLQVFGNLFGAATLNAPMLWTYTGTNSTGGCGTPCAISVTEVELMGPGTIDGNNANRPNPSTSAYGGDIGNIQFTGAHRVRVSGITLLNAWGTGIHTDDSDYVIIIGNHIVNSEDDCIGINQGTFNFTVSGNTCIGPGRPNSFGAPHCVEVEDGSANGIVTADSCSWPLSDCYQISTHVAQRPPHDVAIVGNSCQFPTANGVEVNTANTNVKSYNIAVTGNVIANATKNGISFNRCSSCTASGNDIDAAKEAAGAIYLSNGQNDLITGNSIDWSSYFGIQDSLTEVNATIVGNMITNSGIAVAGSQVAIGLHGKAGFASGNTARDTRTGASRTQQYGIVVYGDSSFEVVQGNRAESNSVNGILIAAGATNAIIQSNYLINNGPSSLSSANIADSGTATVIKYNVNWATEASGTASLVNPATTVVVNHGLQKTPLYVTAIPAANAGAVWITAIGATQFTINVNTSPAGTTTIYWYVQSW